MTGLLWDQVSVMFDSLPQQGKEWSYQYSKTPNCRRFSTDPVVEVKILTRSRLAFSTKEVDYLLQLDEGALKVDG